MRDPGSARAQVFARGVRLRSRRPFFTRAQDQPAAMNPAGDRRGDRGLEVVSRVVI